MELDKLINELPDAIKSMGEANYVITKIIHSSIEGGMHVDYATLNAFIGLLECAKFELYRMVAAPYENKKRMENGPISSLDAKSLEDVR